MTLSRHTQLNPENHKKVFDSLNKEIENISQSLLKEKELLCPIRLRDWDFIHELNEEVAQFFLDWIPSPHDGTNNPLPQAITIDDCLKIHRQLVNQGSFDFLADGVSIQVSSAGIEPPTRLQSDFELAVGAEFEVELWSDAKKTEKRRMVLCSVVSIPEGAQLTFSTRNQETVIPLSQIRRARFLAAPHKSPGKSK